MATYLPGDNPYVQDITPWSPDFNMMQKSLSVRQNRYDQGFGQVQGMYSTMLNSAISGKDNRGVKDMYLQQAQEQLNGIASKDFSISRNVTDAESIFNPFFEDREMMIDMVKTQQNNKADQTMVSYRDSKDPKIREQYNDQAAIYLQGGRKQLENARRGTGEIEAAEVRSFVPFRNITRDLFQNIKDYGISIERVYQNGAYLTKITNGPQTFDAYNALAKSLMGNTYDEQLKVIATNAVDADMEDLKSKNPGLDGEALRAAYADMQLGAFKESANASVNSLKGNLASLNKDLDRLQKDHPEKIESGSPAEDRRNKLVNSIFQAEDLLKKAEEEAVKFNSNTTEDYKRIKAEIMQNPVVFLRQMTKDKEARHWAQQAASASKEEWKVDDVWKEAQVERRWGVETKMKQVKQDFDMSLATARFDRGDGLKQVGTDENGQPVYENKAGKTITEAERKRGAYNSATYQGADGTSAQQQSVYDQVQENNERLKAESDNAFFKPEGVGAVLYNLPGVTQTDVRNFLHATELMNEGKASQTSDEDYESWWLVREALQKELGINNTGAIGLGQIRNMLIQYTENHLEKLRKDPMMVISDEDTAIISSYRGALASQQQLEYNRKRQTEAESALKGDKRFKKIFTDSGTELSVDDLTRAFTGMKVKVGRSGDNSQDYQEIDAGYAAQMYLSGDSISAPAGGNLIKLKDGRTKEFFLTESSEYVNKLKGIIDRYGNAEEHKKIADQFHDETSTKYAPEYFKDGSRGQIYSYGLDPNNKGEIGEQIVAELSNPDNVSGIFVDNQPIGTDHTTLRENFKGMPTEGWEELSGNQINIHTKGPTGKNAVSIKVKADIGEKHPLAAYAGKTIKFEVKPGANTKALRELMLSPQLYKHGKLLREGVLKSDQTMKAAGYDYDAKVSADKRTVRVSVNANTYIPRGIDKDGKETGGMWELKSKMITYDLTGPNAKSVDELVDELDNGFTYWWNGNANNQKIDQEKRKAAATNKGPEAMTIKEYMEAKRKERNAN